MAITKPNVVNAWGQSGVLTDPGVAKTQLGWVVETPAYQTFNWLLNRQDVFNQHVNERGIAEWDALTTYIKGSKVTSTSGNTYKSVINGNLGNNPHTSSESLWIQDSQDEEYLDRGWAATAIVQPAGVTIYVPGDLSSELSNRHKLKLKGTVNGIVYTSINTVSWISGIGQTIISLDKTIAVETLTYIGVGRVTATEACIPFIEGLDDNISKAFGGADEMFDYRKIGHKMVSTPPLVYNKVNSQLLGDSNVVGNNSAPYWNFVEIITEGGIGRVMRITNRTSVTVTVWSNLNHAGWASSTILAGAFQQFSLGAGGFLEAKACSMDPAKPQQLTLTSFASTGAGVDTIFSEVVMTKVFKVDNTEPGV